jgi:protein-L-isoaspartate(D-aspartate) O-methyltransferase
MDVEQYFEKQRLRMVEEQIDRRGIHGQLVLSAFRSVPRHMFVPESLQSRAYNDGPLPIGDGQTISQPYIVALMTSVAKVDADSTVLEIGTGSGYQAAVLSKIVKQVYSIERIPALGLRAEGILSELGYLNVKVKIGDGTLGWPENGPFDAILVTAGAPVIPESLKHQLKTGGNLVIPVGDELSQTLVCLTKTAKGDFDTASIEFVRFVPLIGKEGWHKS